MFTKVSRNETRVRRHKRVRTKISGTPECPRLCVFRSNAHIHVKSLMMLTKTHWSVLQVLT